MEENTTLYEEMNETTEETTNERGSKPNVGLVLLVGGLLGAGAVAGARKLKKVIDNRKAKKAMIVDSEFVDDVIVEDVDSEDDAE